MEKIADKTYEEWLTTIANTRLLYNTMAELENMMDNHSIHSNGIKRCFYTPQKLRAAFRDLNQEVLDMTESLLDLVDVMDAYKETWKFYKENLARRTDPQTVVLELLGFYYPTLQEEVKLGKKKRALFNRVVDENICLPFLILLIMKVIPGYDSKDGDIIEMPRQYESVMSLLDTFTSKGALFSTLPAVTRARNEKNKTRLMLLYHVKDILSVYDSFATSEQVYQTAMSLKENRLYFDLVGYWNECNGLMQSTNFWQFEPASAYNQYFATYWQKSSDMKITGIRYSLFLMNRGDDCLTVYLLHPEAIVHKIKDIPYNDSDNVWYTAAMPTEDQPLKLPLNRLLSSLIWPSHINLTKVTDEKAIALFKRWIEKDCEVVKPFKNYEYHFEISLYAITKKALFIEIDKDEWYYRVPIDAAHGLDRIQMTDSVGILTMGSKTYLAFDELLLFISTGSRTLAKYGIKKVNSID